MSLLVNFQSSNDDNQPIMNGHCKMWTSKRWKKRWLSLRGNVLFVYKASGVCILFNVLFVYQASGVCILFNVLFVC